MQHLKSFVLLIGSWSVCFARCGVWRAAAYAGKRPRGSIHNVQCQGRSFVRYTCQSQTSNIDCLVFQGTKTVRTLTKGLKKPLGVAAGKDGLFYIADESAKDIFVYSAGGAKLVATLSDGSNAPVDVAVYNDEVAAVNKNTLTFFKKAPRSQR